MKEELKTLIELDWHNDYGEGYDITKKKDKEIAEKDGTYPTIEIDVLKKEAIKYLKESEEELKAATKRKSNVLILIKEREFAVQRFIKHFFNIKQSELE